MEKGGELVYIEWHEIIEHSGRLNRTNIKTAIQTGGGGKQ